MNDFRPNFVNDYITRIKRIIDDMINSNLAEEVNKVVDVLLKARAENKTVFIMGNGGSASTASHFACDLSLQIAIEDKPRVKVLGLTDNIAMITARANDIGYESIFKEQLAIYLEEGDVVIGISASGNSPNILNAINYAQEKGATTIGFCGFNGGKLKEYADKSTS